MSNDHDSEFVGKAELHDIHDPHVGAGTPDTAPHFDPGDELPVTDTQPVLVAFAVTALPLVAAFVLSVADAASASVPAWIVAVLTGLGPLLGALAALWARAKVTPVARPRLDDETPLAPVEAPVP